MKKTLINELLGVKHPIIMAPMFLVTNTKMMIEAMNSGIAACIPALNYRTDQELKNAIQEIRTNTTSKGLGINLIVNKSNIKMKQQLKTCVELGVDFIITSLGSPKKVIEQCKPKGIKVFCDVVEEKYAKKVEELGADAVIAVNKNAGGHAGKLSPEEIIPLLNKHCSIPVISAGGVGTKEGIDSIMNLGAAGLSIGSPFIACEEAHISEEYKNACVAYGKEDIVFTTKISGTPCTVINTPYVQKTGTTQNWLEKLMSKNKKIKKWMKMITYFNGMKSLEKAAFSSTYNTVWCAGPSIEHTIEILSVKEIVKKLI
ncbi:MAG: nitronate monooxygenase [Flavobacteriales bacterium]|jgi:nitronate monooxygenase|nr:nitronate monooxygenase [Flavobacteriales bacterium]MBT5089672.1 nitronate monooxygenase [Flavobacteriales bacterium]